MGNRQLQICCSWFVMALTCVPTYWLTLSLATNLSPSLFQDVIKINVWKQTSFKPTYSRISFSSEERRFIICVLLCQTHYVIVCSKYSTGTAYILKNLNIFSAVDFTGSTCFMMTIYFFISKIAEIKAFMCICCRRHFLKPQFIVLQYVPYYQRYYQNIVLRNEVTK